MEESFAQTKKYLQLPQVPVAFKIIVIPNMKLFNVTEL